MHFNLDLDFILRLMYDTKARSLALGTRYPGKMVSDLDYGLCRQAEIKAYSANNILPSTLGETHSVGETID